MPGYLLVLARRSVPLTDYLTEQEQIQQLKNWIKQYGLTILAGILIALLITSGWHYWQNYKNKLLTHASGVYDEMLTARAQGNKEELRVQANKLLTHYPKTPYAQMAAFMIARDAVLKNNYPEAINQLNWVIQHTSTHSIREIAKLRIARILITQKKPQEAIDLLNKIDDKNFIGLIQEVRGDAFLSMNDLNSARKSYELAMKEIPNSEVTRPILQMKLDDLATTH